MRSKFEVGATIEFVTEAEVRKVLAEYSESWRAERARGVKFRNFGGQTTMTGATFQIGGAVASSNQEALGPAAGFVWSVTRMVVSGPGFNAAADSFNVFLDEPAAARGVLFGQFAGGPYPVGTIVLSGRESLVITGPSTGTAGGGIFLSGQAVELPVSLSWMLLGR